MRFSKIFGIKNVRQEWKIFAKYTVVRRCSLLSSKICQTSYSPHYKSTLSNDNKQYINRFCTTSLSFNENKRYFSNSSRKKSTLYYILSIGVLVVGLSYAAVPLYRIFCQVGTIYITYIYIVYNFSFIFIFLRFKMCRII